MTSRFALRAPLTFVLALGVLSAACATDPEKAKQQYFESGNRYFEQKKFAEAIVEYRNAIKIDARFGEARLKLATSYLQTGDMANGVREQIRAADLLPQNYDAQVDAGNLLLLAGRFEDAKARASRVLETDAGNVRAQVLLGNALAGLKDFDGAIAEVEEALALDPGRVSTYTSLGTLQLARGNRGAAEETFKRAVEKDPTSIPARLALANFYWTVGDQGPAEKMLRALATEAPQDTRTVRALSNYLLATKRVAEAEQYLVALTKLDGSASTRLRLADYYISAGRANEAAPLLQSIDGTDKAAVLAAIRLAGIDVRAGRMAEAERRVDEVLRSNGGEAEALLLKAAILAERKEIDEAVKKVKAAVDSNPSSARAQFALGKLYVAQRKPDEAKKAFSEALQLNPRAAEAQVELARMHLAQGSFDTGVDLAGQAVKNDPASVDARLLLARGFVAKKDLPRALQILNELAAAAPKSAAVRAQLGLVQAVGGDRAAAAKTFDEALALDANNLEATAGLITLDLAAKQFDKAKARAAERIGRTPSDSNALLLAGKTYLATGETKQAEEAMRRAIEADPDNLGAYEALGTLYVRTQRLPEAQQEFEALATRQSRPVSALTMVGLIQQGRKQMEDARKTYERVLEISPNAAVAANNLAWIYVDTGVNLDLALQLARTAKAGLPKHAEISDTLGWIYYRKGLFPLAVRELEEAVRREPGNPLYHYHLGVAYKEAGNRDRAKHSLETALRLQSDFDGAKDAARVLGTL